MNPICMRSVLLTAAALASSCLFAQPANYKIANNTPGFIKSAVDQGPVDPATVITVNVWLKLRNQQQLDKLVEQQKQGNSPSYHRWITQDEFNGVKEKTNISILKLMESLEVDVAGADTNIQIIERKSN